MMENDPYTPQNDQQPQGPVVLPPANFQAPQEPQGPLDKLKNRFRQPKLALAIVLGLILLVVGGVLLAQNDKQVTNTNPGTDNKTVFKNWLEPKNEIKVGENRYISICKVLPVQTVIDTMYRGQPPDNFMVMEEYYDVSPVEEKFKRPETSCSYGDIAKLDADQYFNAADTKFISNVVYSLGDQYMDAKVAAYKKVAESSNDETLKKFVAQIDASTKTFNEKKDSLSTASVANIDTSSLIIPIGNSAVEFNFFYNNVVYKLALTTNLSASKVAEAPSGEIATQLLQAKQLIDEVYKNSKNTTLDQSPAPTIIGKTAKVGETYILEPCAVLNSQIVESVLGVTSQPAKILRASTLYNLDKQTNSKAGYAIYPSNDCERTVVSSNGTKTTIKLDIEHAPNASALDKKLADAKYTELDADDTKLQTSADFAAEYVVGTVRPFYQFRVGNYWMYMTISTIEPTSGKQGVGTRDQHVTTINKIVESIKSNSKEAESTQGR